MNTTDYKLTARDLLLCACSLLGIDVSDQRMLTILALLEVVLQEIDQGEASLVPCNPASPENAWGVMRALDELRDTKRGFRQSLTAPACAGGKVYSPLPDFIERGFSRSHLTRAARNGLIDHTQEYHGAPYFLEEGAVKKYKADKRRIKQRRRFDNGHDLTPEELRQSMTDEDFALWEAKDRLGG